MSDTQKKLTLPIHGMTCGGCVQGVKKALQKIPQVDAVEVSLENKSATVSYRMMDETTMHSTLTKAIENAGFEVR